METLIRKEMDEVWNRAGRMVRTASRIRKEMDEARQKYGPFNSTHEAYAVLQEEVNEFWEQVRWSKQDGKRKSDMIKELTQIAAVAQRTIRELQEGEIKWV